MPVKLRKNTNRPDPEKNPMDYDSTQEQRETTVEGYTFHWGLNQTRNFADDGVGLAHAAFSTAAEDNIVADIKPFNDARS